MPGENYRRIVKGYEPIELPGFFEKVFYILWLVVCPVEVLANMHQTKGPKGK